MLNPINGNAQTDGSSKGMKRSSSLELFYCELLYLDSRVTDIIRIKYHLPKSKL